MSKSVMEGSRMSSLHHMDDEVLDDVVRQVRSAFVHPVGSNVFDLRGIRDFLDLTLQIAQQAGVHEEEELELVLDQAARMYITRCVQDRVSGMLQLTLEWSGPPTQGEAAFFRKFATNR